MNQREALKLALEAFLMCSYLKLQPHSVQQICDRTIIAIKEALAQPELTLDGLTPTEFALRELYEFQEATGCDTAAEFKAQRTWQGLTDEEIAEIAATPAVIPGSYVHSFARAIEAKLKEKNA